MNSVVSDAQFSSGDEQPVSPGAAYRQALGSGEFMADAVQQAAIHELDQTWQALVSRYEFQKQKKRLRRQLYPVPRGVYMWGGVGRGKTWLMDLFYDALPFRRKLRLHFHHFMQRVHRELIALKGQRDPLDTVADIIYRDAVVICFDEFFVSNVTDAMLLGDLFTKLFARGVTLVATSNVEPDQLYRDGIHRDRFLPAIDILKKHNQVLNVDSGTDYRLRVLKQAELFHAPLSTAADHWITERFNALAHGYHVSASPITVNNREILTLAHTDDLLWCDFTELCLKPRSAADFIELANTYHTVLVSRVPVLTDQISDATRRFIYLVDEFYDRRVKLVITSQDAIIDLYQGEKLKFEIERTRSRLLEMQSDLYLGAQHRVTLQETP